MPHTDAPTDPVLAAADGDPARAADGAADRAEGSREPTTMLRAAVRPLAFHGWRNDPWALGAYSYARPGGAGSRLKLAAAVENRLFFAGEACSPESYSTAHGAYRTGRAAAEDAIRAIART